MKEVLIDCDGVLADFHSMAIELIKEIAGEDRVPDTIEEWEMLDHPDLYEFKPEFWKVLTTRKGIIRNLKPYDYALDMLEKLRSRYEVSACTSLVSGVYASERTEWLIQEAGFNRKDIFICYKKYKVNGDVLIDDKPSNITSWKKTHPYGLGCIWKPPNRKIKVPIGVYSTGSADELIERIEKYYEV